MPNNHPANPELAFDDDPFLDENSEVLPNGNSRPIGSAMPKGESLIGDPVDLTELAGKKPKAVQVNHNSRSRQHWERQGYVYYFGEGQEIVSRWNGGHAEVYGGRKFDILGLFDALCFKVGSPVVGVQTCSKAGFNEHIRSMCGRDEDKRSGNRRNVDNLRLWLDMGFQAYVMYWEERAKVGNQKWFPVITEVDYATIEGVEKRRRK